MSEKTTIQWTHDTFNPWWGCQRVSPGCEHCYAETFAHRVGKDLWGPKAEHRVASESYWQKPIAWNNAAIHAGARRRVFCASMADVFEDRRDLDAPRARLFSLIEATPALDWLVLTKRPQNMLTLAPSTWAKAWPLNVWAGTTVENQKYADERHAHLRAVPAAVRFYSVEPQIGPIDSLPLDGIHWAISGGESGGKARPFALEWARSLIAQCRAAGTAPFVKQMGQKPTLGGAPVKFLDSHGGEPEEWPEDIRVREFPTPAMPLPAKPFAPAKTPKAQRSLLPLL